MMMCFLGVLNIVTTYVTKPHSVTTYASVTPT